MWVRGTRHAGTCAHRTGVLSWPHGDAYGRIGSETSRLSQPRHVWVRVAGLEIPGLFIIMWERRPDGTGWQAYVAVPGESESILQLWVGEGDVRKADLDVSRG